jgi:hypothetical protein
MGNINDAVLADCCIDGGLRMLVLGLVSNDHAIMPPRPTLPAHVQDSGCDPGGAPMM